MMAWMLAIAALAVVAAYCAYRLGQHQARDVIQRRNLWDRAIWRETAYSTTEVAEAAGILPRAVRRAIYSGELPAQQLGREWLIWEADAYRWIERRCRAEAKNGCETGDA